MTVQPISPERALEESKGVRIPDCVIRATNELVVKNLRNGCASFTLDDLVTLAAQYSGMSGSLRDSWVTRMFDENAFNIEPVFRAQGWHVQYDKPGYCETDPATFKFSVSERHLVEQGWG